MFIGIRHKIFLFSLLYCLIINISHSQNLGIPPIQNITKTAYGAGPEIWDVKCTDQHVLFANNSGLLSFNGHRWLKNPTPNNTVMRSLCIASDNKIYIGAQDEVGFFDYLENGVLKFNDLKPLLATEYQNLDEIWDIEFVNGTLFFSSGDQIIAYSEEQQRSFGKKGQITQLSKVRNGIWYHAIGSGIYQINQNEERFIKGSSFTKNFDVINFISISSDSTYIITKENGIYLHYSDKIKRVYSNASNFLDNHRVTAAVYSDRFGLCLGTAQAGIIIIDQIGKTQFHFSKKNGLQNNSINSLDFSKNNVLWVGTKNGIDRIDLAALINRFYPDGELHGAVYDIIEWKNNLFFATVNGLYYIPLNDYYNPLENQTYKLVDGTQGQSWGLDIINEKLFFAHHDGAFEITENFLAKRLNQDNGVWKFISLDEKHIAIGHYKGVSVYKFDNRGRAVRKFDVSNLSESSRVMVLDKDKNLWVSHPYKQVYKIDFDSEFNSSSVKTYSSKNGFETDKRNYVFNINDQCYLTNETGVYVYNSQQDSFRRAAILNQYFEKYDHVRSLIQSDNYIWSISNSGTKKFNYNPGSFENNIDKENLYGIITEQEYIGGFENLYPVSKNEILICTNEGVAEYNTELKKLARPSAFINTITIPTYGDSLLYGGFGNIPESNLESHLNSLHIEFSSSDLPIKNEMLFSYQLEGQDTSWSAWTKYNTKDYINIQPGDYRFLLKSKNVEGLESKIASFPFSIIAPWYKSKMAYLIYALSALLLITLLVMVPKKKYEANTAILETKKKETEKELEKIKQAKLESEIAFKNKELAMSTMYLVQKNETLNAIRDEIEKVEKTVKDNHTKSELKNIFNLLKSDDNLEEDWNNFSIHFDQVHHDFLKRIKKEYPKLTPKDQKLCAYLRMNLSTKEIAPLLKISVRGVEISRYRLRKKIALSPDVNLNEFMMQF